MIDGTMSVTLTLAKVNYYNELEARDTEMPLIEGKYMKDGEEGKYYTCPVCGEYIWTHDVFCRSCGQRIDTENVAL